MGKSPEQRLKAELKRTKLMLAKRTKLMLAKRAALMNQAAKAPRMPVVKKKTPKPMTKEQKAKKDAILKEAMRMATLDRSAPPSTVFETKHSGFTLT
tara:strand:- start:168 stop:458 length:291 start_codon:yes stop_codon:yes gene_type:complete